MLVLPKIKTAANVDMVCFDKTGTLTESEVRVCGVEKAKVLLCVMSSALATPR